VVGVVQGWNDPRAQLAAFVPVDDAARSMTGMRAPAILFAAPAIEDVDRMRKEAESWLQARYGATWKDRAQVETNQARVKQVATGMLVFKLLMGAITGVSLLVGGIGIMNVLLAAVAERTREIGIRKAMGARNRDILVQFLSESVTITSFGATIGVALGLGIAFLTAWIMRVQTKAPVEAAVTPATILVVAGLSVAIGLTFGLYPARRAAGLSPIDAIRHE
jgi:putative ABC transport system permease protein